MIENEAAAHELVTRLSTVGIDARVSGGGVHWQVDIGPVASRTLRVHCFWYERERSGLVLGMNPGNSRSRLRVTLPPYEGPEYLVSLHQESVHAADGRAHSPEEVVTCARAWLAGVTLDELVADAPFIHARRRAMHALAERLDHQLRWDIGTDPSYELWVYGENRSCKVMAVDDAVVCSFLIGQAQVAQGQATALDEVAAMVGTWLVSRVPPSELATRFPSVELECHAEVLETDPARWHWLHLRDRIADPDDVLAPLRDLIQALAESPVATRFFSFSSMDRFCFSASSHYPWVRDGLPVVTPAAKGVYLVGEKRCNLRRAVQLIEATLMASPLRPFFGSAPHYQLPLLSENLARQGSALRPQLVQREAWYELVVADAAGTRICNVDTWRITFMDAIGQLDASWPSDDDVVRAIRHFCEGGASLDEIASDPRAQHVSKRSSRSS